MRLVIDFGTELIMQNQENNLRMIKEAGFDGVDYDIMDWQAGDNYKTIAKEIRAQLDEIGLCCPQVHATHNFTYGGKMDFSNPQYAENFHAIEFAAILGAERCVIHGSSVPDGPLSGQFTEHNYMYYKTFEEEAKRCGIYIGVENLKWGILPRPEYVNRLLNLLDSSVYYPHVDIGHSALVGIEPDVFIKKINCLPIRGIHVHDFNVQTDHVFPFLGNSDWDRIVKALVDVGYDGDMCMELFMTRRMIASYSEEMLPAMFKLSAEIGHELIGRIEKEKRSREQL